MREVRRTDAQMVVFFNQIGMHGNNLKLESFLLDLEITTKRVIFGIQRISLNSAMSVTIE